MLTIYSEITPEGDLGQIRVEEMYKNFWSLKIESNIEYSIGPEIFSSFTEIFPYNGVIYFLDRRNTKKLGKIAIFLKYTIDFFFQLTDVPRFSFHHKIQKFSNWLVFHRPYCSIWRRKGCKRHCIFSHKSKEGQ